MHFDDANKLSKEIHIKRLERYFDDAQISMKSQDLTKALSRYSWNLEISAFFYKLISIHEVIMRNRVIIGFNEYVKEEHKNSESIRRLVGMEWPLNALEIDFIPQNDDVIRHLNGAVQKLAKAISKKRDILEKEKKEQQKAERKLKKDKGAKKKKKAVKKPNLEITNPGVVAQLTYDFWRHLFGSQYYDILINKWDSIFPYWSGKRVDYSNIRESAHGVRNKLNSIGGFRNRLAHVEPIFYFRDLIDKRDEIVNFTGNMSNECWKLMNVQELEDILKRAPK